MENIIMPSPYKVLAITKITDIEYLYRVEYPMTDKVQFGQFMQLSLPKVGECPISITDFSVEDGWLEFLIRKVGIVTDEIFKMTPGEMLPMRGPYGKGFDMKNYEGKKVIVATGGSGLAPVRSLIKYMYNNPNKVEKFELLCGFKDNDAILFRDEIAKWSEKVPTILTVDKSCGIEGECIGLVTEHVPQLKMFSEDFSNIEVIIVGPPMMMKYTALEFLKLGIQEKNIWVSFERKMSCAVGKCGHCRIDETYVCLEGPVFNYEQAKYLID